MKFADMPLQKTRDEARIGQPAEDVSEDRLSYDAKLLIQGYKGFCLVLFGRYPGKVLYLLRANIPT